MAAKRRGRQPHARAEAVALPRREARRRRKTGLRVRLAPSARSIVIGLGIAVAAIGAYVLARETSAFAIRQIEVSGAPAPVAAQVQQALAPLVGTSLVGLNGGRLEARVDALPTVVSTSYDRAFPHTLRISVVTERPVAVVRKGAEAWLVSARGRVVQRVARAAEPALPRIWLPRAAAVATGAFLVPERGGDAAHALSFTSRFPYRIQTATTAAGSLVFHLSSGIDLRVGDVSDMRLKLAVARRALRQLPAGATYLDVGLPGRPVAGTYVAPAPPAVTATTPAPTGTTATTPTTATATTSTAPAATTTTPTTPNPQVSTGA